MYQGLRLSRNLRTPENDHLHIYSLWSQQCIHKQTLDHCMCSSCSLRRRRRAAGRVCSCDEAMSFDFAPLPGSYFIFILLEANDMRKLEVWNIGNIMVIPTLRCDMNNKYMDGSLFWFLFLAAVHPQSGSKTIHLKAPTLLLETENEYVRTTVQGW